MTRFFLVLGSLLILLGSFVSVTPAMGVSDFVAVADSPASAVYNPAGLTQLNGNDFLAEHRFTGRDVAFGWDDLLVYSVSEPNGTGAVFMGYSQDQWDNNLYTRYQMLGYSYGWRSTEAIALGLTGKFTKRGVYTDFTGTMERQASEGEFLLDFGMLFNTSTHTKLGFSIHNIGQSSSVEGINYQTTLGFAYQKNHITLAMEIYDLLDEGDGPIEGSLARAGFRYRIIPQFSLHAVWEESIDDWNFTGRMAGLEYQFENFGVMATWYQAEGDYLSEDSLQATVRYHF